MQTFGSQETMSEIAKWQPLEQTQAKPHFVWFTQCSKEFVLVCFRNQRKGGEELSLRTMMRRLCLAQW